MSENEFVITREIVSTNGEEWVAFDALPKVVRRALVEANYEYSARDTVNLLEVVAHQFPYTPQNMFRNITRRDIEEECARHILDTDRLTRQTEQRRKLGDFKGWLRNIGQSDGPFLAR